VKIVNGGIPTTAAAAHTPPHTQSTGLIGHAPPLPATRRASASSASRLLPAPHTPCKPASLPPAPASAPAAVGLVDSSMLLRGPGAVNPDEPPAKESSDLPDTATAEPALKSPPSSAAAAAAMADAAAAPGVAAVLLAANSLCGGAMAHPWTSYGSPFVSCRVGLMRMVASRGSRARRSVPARGTSTWFCVVK
jgi:hypothetical protein